MIWPPAPEPLEGSIVRLEPIDERHREPLLAASGDSDTWTWMDRRVPGDASAFSEWFDVRLNASRAGSEWCFVTVSADTSEPIGSSSYLHVRPEHDGLEIGWTWLHPSAWRTGANREAKLLMLGYAFDELGAMRVEFKTDARNERSRNALTALGASFEGIFRKHMLMPVVGVRDSAYFSIVDDEWPRIATSLRAGIESREGARS